MKRLKRNSKIVIAFILGLVITSAGVYAATTIVGSNVTYSNTKSGLSSTNVQGAIDELYEKTDVGKVINKAGNFVIAYTYSESGSNLCIMGNEATCQKTTCYQVKTAGSCPAGTIILYKVNNNNIGWFNVLVDKGNTMTMQSQKNILKNSSIIWAPSDNKSGPTTVLPAMENATSSWSNVNNQTYSIGDSSSTLGYSGCSAYNSCTNTMYPKLEKSNVKARMITVQEAVNYGGCTDLENSCRKFMTGNVTESYWTMSATLYSSSAWYVHYHGRVYDNGVNVTYGARAVVEVTK